MGTLDSGVSGRHKPALVSPTFLTNSHHKDGKDLTPRVPALCISVCVTVSAANHRPAEAVVQRRGALDGQSQMKAVSFLVAAGAVATRSAASAITASTTACRD